MIWLVYLIRCVIIVFWILDICNMPFMEIFDTTYPLNGLFWFLIFIFLGGGVSGTNKSDDE